MAEGRRIYLMRHGEPEAGPSGRVMLGCLSDPGLSEAGRAAAIGLRGWYQGEFSGTCISSPSKRCIETALLATGCSEIETIECLTEVDLGRWDGLTKDAIRKNWPLRFFLRGLFPGSARPAGGESLAAHRRRIRKCFNRITGAYEGDLFIVTHAGVIAAVTGIKGSPGRMFPYCSITEIIFSGGQQSLFENG